MPSLPEITVDATTGATIAIASSNIRQEVLLRARGASRIYLGFNEAAIVGQGIWLNSGDGVVIARPLCTADIYMVAATTCYVGAETVEG